MSYTRKSKIYVLIGLRDKGVSDHRIVSTEVLLFRKHFWKGAKTLAVLVVNDDTRASSCGHKDQCTQL